MPAKAGKRYDPQTKAAIIEAAVAARKDGKPWAEAFPQAKAAGYTGTQQGLEQMIRVAKGKAAKKETAARKPARRVRRGRRPAAKAQAARAFGGDVSSIGALVEKIVKDRVRAVLDRVIADLKRARGQ